MRGFVFVLALVILTSGCARTVTPRVAYGEQMSVTVTLRDTMALNSNRYFLVLSSGSGLKVPLPYPDINNNSPEFLEPGMTPQLGTAEAYYSSYFGTWSGYIELDPGGYFLTKGLPESPWQLWAALTIQLILLFSWRGSLAAQSRIISIMILL